MQQALTGVFTMPCTPATTLGAYLRVKYDATYGLALAGATEDAIGYLADAALASGLGAQSTATVISNGFPGVIRAIASGVIAVDGDVYAGASGMVAGTGTIRVGKNVGTATTTSGDYIDMVPAMALPDVSGAASGLTGTNSSSFTADADSGTAKVAIGTGVGTGNYTATIVAPTLAANRTITLPAVAVTLASLTGTETLTNKTLTSPTINSPTIATPTITSPAVTGAAATGIAVTKVVPFIENATNTVHTGTVPIPAGATILNIQIVNTVLWGATSAGLIVGDSFDDNGYFETVNCKATDLLVGEVLDISNAENWGGKNGAYLVAATGRKGNVQAGNSGIYYGVADNIIGVMSVGTPAATTGRTFMIVTYVVGETIAAVATGP